jgi:hypothetical protein
MFIIAFFVWNNLKMAHLEKSNPIQVSEEPVTSVINPIINTKQKLVPWKKTQQEHATRAVIDRNTWNVKNKT